MANCEIVLTIPELGIYNKKFDSNEELDGWLFDHQALVEHLNSGYTYSLSVTPEQADAKLKIDKASSRYRQIQAAKLDEKNNQRGLFLNILGFSEEKSTPVTVGPTTLFDYVGMGKDLDQPITRFGNRTGQTSERDEKVKKIRTGVGKDLEKAFDEKLTGKAYSASKPNVIKGTDKETELLSVASTVYSKIKDQHPNGQIYTQVPIVAKEISDTFRSAIKTKMGAIYQNGTTLPAVKLPGQRVKDVEGHIHDATGEDINTIVGVIDLLIIDPDGSVYIYDFKTSEHDVTALNSPGYAAQLASYRNILSQWGLTVKGMYLIPMKVDYDWNQNLDVPENVYKGISINTGHWRDEVMEGNEYAMQADKWFPVHINLSFGEMNETNNIIEKAFPGGTISTAERLIEGSVEQELQYIETIDSSDPSYAHGNRFRYWKRGFIADSIEKRNRNIDAKTKEELREKIGIWITEQNESRGKIYHHFAKDLKQAMQSRNPQSLETLASNYNQSHNEYIIRAFGRYINYGWELVSNDIMIANGYLLFQKGENVELVVLSNHNINNQMVFDHGKTRNKYTSVLGNFMADSEGVDNRWFLPNFYGNIEMMKGMIFLGQNLDIFKGRKVNKVSTVSLLSPGYMEEDNEKLCENYKALRIQLKKYEKIDIPVLSIGTEFVDSTTSWVKQAVDLIGTRSTLSDILKSKEFENLDLNHKIAIKQIKKLIEKLRNANGDKRYDVRHGDYNDVAWRALAYLNRAWLAAISYQVSPDLRTGAYTNGGFALDGHMAKSPADAKSAVLRTLHEATYGWTRVCQTEFIEYTNEWKLAVKELYESVGHSLSEGGEWNVFKRFFVQDVNGNIDPKFKLKASMDSPVEQRVLNLIFKAIERFKYGNKPEKIEIAKGNGTYWEVPLMRSTTGELAGKTSIVKVWIDKLKTDTSAFRDFLIGTDVSVQRLRELRNINKGELESIIFDEEEREQHLKNNGFLKYTTNLDYIFNAIAAEGIKREKSPYMLLTASAIRGTVAYMVYNGANFGEEFEDSIEKYVTRKIFGRPIINEGNENVQRIINVLKGITSVITIGASLKGLTRETITGIMRGYELLNLRPDLKRRIKVEDYTSAINEIIAHCHDNADVMSLHMQLNAIYGTANFSYGQLAKNSTITKLGYKNFELSDLFFTATWPDFLHRNAIVIAYLKGIGAWDAYKMENGILKYDMKKDNRFKTFLKYKDDPSSIPDSDVKQFEKERDLYKQSFDSWKNNNWTNSDGSEFVYGQDLPQALSPRDVMALKDIADRMYGNYDEETESLMKSQLLGSLFLQFRTYGLSRVQEFLDGDHFTSDITMEVWKLPNENGEYEEVYYVENPDKNAVLSGESTGYVAKLASEVSLDDIKSGKAVKAYYPTSYYTQGHLQAFIDMGMTLFVFHNQEEFDKMWKQNPTYRAHLAVFMMDTFGMLLLAFIINQLYSGALNGEYDDIDWFTQWSYNVAIGITQDGPMWSVLSSVVGDGTPPMLGIMQNYVNNITSVITGKKNFMYGLANTFGATRELAYLFNMR